METRKLVVTAMAVACLALGACGDGERTNVSLPSNITRPERTTTVPPEAEAPDESDRTTAPPLTQPDTGGPTTEAPDTEPPATDPPPPDPPPPDDPATDPGTTDLPTTDPPTTETPTTETPTTETPTTETPTTETPTTETPTTETPTTEEPGPTDPATDPEEVADESTPWWPWLLAGLAVIGPIVFVARRRSRQAAALKQRTAVAFDASTRLATHLAAVSPDGAVMVAAQDAPQLADLAATLSALEAETADPAGRRAIGSVRGQVVVLHGVVGGIAMGPGATPTALDYMKEQAVALHGTTARARAELFPPPPVPANATA